jgi:hypothetical protein
MIQSITAHPGKSSDEVVLPTPGGQTYDVPKQGVDLFVEIGIRHADKQALEMQIGPGDAGEPRPEASRETLFAGLRENVIEPDGCPVYGRLIFCAGRGQIAMQEG